MTTECETKTNLCRCQQLLYVFFPLGIETKSDPAVQTDTQRQLRYIEWKGVKIYDFQKVTFSTLFKLHIAGLGVLIPKRYHMLG